MDSVEFDRVWEEDLEKYLVQSLTVLMQTHVDSLQSKQREDFSGVTFFERRRICAKRRIIREAESKAY